jgi:hypothetical protein
MTAAAISLTPGMAQGGVAKGCEPVIYLPIDLANSRIDGIGLGEMRSTRRWGLGMRPRATLGQ